jgi:hypothetical protein
MLARADVGFQTPRWSKGDSNSWSHPERQRSEGAKVARRREVGVVSGFQRSAWSYLDDPNGRHLVARWKERPGMLGLRF